MTLLAYINWPYRVVVLLGAVQMILACYICGDWLECLILSCQIIYP